MQPSRAGEGRGACSFTRATFEPGWVGLCWVDEKQPEDKNEPRSRVGNWSQPVWPEQNGSASAEVGWLAGVFVGSWIRERQAFYDNSRHSSRASP